MELIEVEILTQAVTAQYGTLKTGDILRTDAAFAKHLVEDAHAAKYVVAKSVVAKQEAKELTVARVAKPRAKPVPVATTDTSAEPAATEAPAEPVAGEASATTTEAPADTEAKAQA